MKQTKYDYPALKQEYVTSPRKISIRALCVEHGIKTWSTVATRARKDKWSDARDQYNAMLEARSIEVAVDQEAVKIATIRKDTLEVIHGAVLKMGMDLEDHWVEDPKDPTHMQFVPGTRVRPDEIVRLIDKFLVMSGQVTERTAKLGLSVDVDPDDIPIELARELAAAARAAGAGAGPVGQSPLPGGAAPKQVN